jgi:hypothetical protein
MARQVANVDIQVDTFGSWITRTNQLFDILSSEVVTANSTSGITGSTTSPRNATLYGRFSTNTLITSNTFQVASAISANSTMFTFGPSTRIVANNKIGVSGQILAIGTGGYLYWTNAGTGTVTRVQGGNGLTGDITSSGSLTVKPSSGINVTSAGVSVDSDYIATLNSANAARLASKTWEAPNAIGTTTANTGKFTSITGTSYSITGDPVFVLNGDLFRSTGWVDATTPNDGTTGGYRLRGFAGAGAAAYFQVTNSLGSTEWGNAKIDSTGKWSWSGALSTTGAFTAASASLTGNLTISTANALGGGLTLSDAGDIADLNDGYASMRFASGVNVYSGNKTGTSAIRLKNTGVIEATGKIYTGGKEVLTVDSFTNGAGVGAGSTSGSSGNWVKLPNGMLLQWGTIPSQQDSTATVVFPQAFTSPRVAVTVSGGVKNNNDSAGENPTTVVSVSSVSFQTWTTENVNTTAWWIAMGF